MLLSNNLKQKIETNNNSSIFRDKHTKYKTYLNNNKYANSTTLDTKHNEKINEFDNSILVLQKKIKKQKKIICDLNKINSIPLSDLTKENINDKSLFKNELEILNIEINQLRNRFNELDYYDSVMDILIEYYDGKQEKERGSKKNKEDKENKDDKEDKEGKEGKEGKEIKENKESNILYVNDLFKKKITSQNEIQEKSKLHEKYMKIVYNTESNKNKGYVIKMCSKCKIEKTLNISCGYLICTSCGSSEPILIETDKPTYRDSNIDLKTCAYKRTNHLSEILNQLQAKESTEIPQEIYEQIKNELNKQRIFDYKLLDHKLVKKILKKLKLNKYYEHTHHIINNLNGTQPPTMTREQEENIKRIFKEIQKPFALYKPKERTNFLNYNYIIHKICELLEYDEFLIYFPLLKSRVNLEEQDVVWEKICKYKNYQFIPSI